MNLDIGSGSIWFAFGLTFLAGLSTGIGSLMALLSKKFNPKFLTAALGFSAGVMIYVSMIEIFVKANESLIHLHGGRRGYFYTTLAFFCGMGLIALIDKIVPNFENPHELGNINQLVDSGTTVSTAPDKGKLYRMGIFSALAIAIHNFPEGLATFIGALKDPALGISIAVAIAIHNIPEGIAVLVPIFYATTSRKKAFSYSFVSGLAEPVGAVIGYFLLRTIFSEGMFGVIFAGVAGIMVYISLDELLPTAEAYGQHHIAISGVVAGMILMSASLIMFS